MTNGKRKVNIVFKRSLSYSELSNQLIPFRNLILSGKYILYIYTDSLSAYFTRVFVTSILFLHFFGRKNGGESCFTS